MNVTTMSRQDRVLAAIAGSPTDRVPLDINMNAFVETRLHGELGTTTHRQLLERLNVDIVDLRGVVDPVYRGPKPLSQELGNGVRQNIWGWRQKVMQTATGPEDSYVEFVLADATLVDDLERHTWPSPDWFDFTDFTDRLHEWDDFAIMASGVSVFQHPTFLRGIDNLLMDMAIRPEMAEYLMDRYTEFYLTYYDRMLTAAGGRIDILRVADDVGMQNALLLSPAMFDQFIAPRLSRFVELAHHHGAKLMFHSCGAIRPLIESIIALGVDILDPLQAAADDMEPEGLATDFGNRICLHGGICTQHLLPQGTADQVQQEAWRRRDIHAGSRYILAPCHVLQTDVPTANILALADAAVLRP